MKLTAEQAEVLRRNGLCAAVHAVTRETKEHLVVYNKVTGQFRVLDK